MLRRPHCLYPHVLCACFFSHDTAPTEIYTLSLHDALPISQRDKMRCLADQWGCEFVELDTFPFEDRKSTRLNSSHLVISYAVFCLKKKRKKLLCCWCP